MTSKQTKNLLNRAYTKPLKSLQKDFFVKNTTGLLLFVEYLKYLRDSLILKTSKNINDIEKLKIKVSTIIAAITEFEAYLKSKDIKDEQQKKLHWNNFCELIKQNMEEWLKTDDPI